MLDLVQTVLGWSLVASLTIAFWLDVGSWFFGRAEVLRRRREREARRYK